MSGLPAKPTGLGADKAETEFDLDLELDDLDELDDAALQKLLDDDPELAEELKAIEEEEQQATASHAEAKASFDEDLEADDPEALELEGSSESDNLDLEDLDLSLDLPELNEIAKGTVEDLDEEMLGADDAEEVVGSAEADTDTAAVASEGAVAASPNDKDETDTPTSPAATVEALDEGLIEPDDGFVDIDDIEADLQADVSAVGSAQAQPAIAEEDDEPADEVVAEELTTAEPITDEAKDVPSLEVSDAEQTAALAEDEAVETIPAGADEDDVAAEQDHATEATAEEPVADAVLEPEPAPVAEEPSPNRLLPRTLAARAAAKISELALGRGSAASTDTENYDVAEDEPDTGSIQDEALQLEEAPHEAVAEESLPDAVAPDTDDQLGSAADDTDAVAAAETAEPRLPADPEPSPATDDDISLTALPPREDDLSIAEEVAAPPTFVSAPEHDDLADFDPKASPAPLPPLVAERGPDTGEMNAVEAEEEGEGWATDGHTDVSLLDAQKILPIPRISIHAFCVTEHFKGLMEQASADRRLSKAHVTLEKGDAARASDYYSNEVTPNLLIIETGKDVSALLAGLDSLAEVCDPSTRVIVVGGINDIQLYRALVERGINEYLVKPQSPLEIIASIGDLYADPDAPPLGKTFVFVGARGGTGSSSVCHNVAWALAEKIKSDTVLMDLDLAFGTAGLDFEFNPDIGLAEALEAPERLDEILLDRLLKKCTERLDLFIAPNSLDREYDLPPTAFETVIDIVRNSAPSIVIDLPHMWSGWSRMLLQTADEIVLTSTPDLASFRNSKNILESIKAHRTNDAPPILVLNQVGVPKRPEVPAEQFEEALGIAPQVMVPWEPTTFGQAATNAQTVIELAPKSKASAEIIKIAELLTGQRASAEPGLAARLKSLLGKG